MNYRTYFSRFTIPSFCVDLYLLEQLSTVNINYSMLNQGMHISQLLAS